MRACRFSTDLIRGSGIETIPMTGTPFQNSNELILKYENGNTDIGFDAIFNLTGKVTILFPLLPAMFLLKISGIGDVAYKIVSRKRHNGKIQWLFSFLNRLQQSEEELENDCRRIEKRLNEINNID